MCVFELKEDKGGPRAMEASTTGLEQTVVLLLSGLHARQGL